MLHEACGARWGGGTRGRVEDAWMCRGCSAEAQSRYKDFTGTFFGKESTMKSLEQKCREGEEPCEACREQTQRAGKSPLSACHRAVSGKQVGHAVAAAGCDCVPLEIQRCNMGDKR